MILSSIELRCIELIVASTNLRSSLTEEAKGLDTYIRR
jgi:hypothetical protein